MVHWGGFIGCGSVTEKSGPAFGKVEESDVVAVMRRNAEKRKIMPGGDGSREHGMTMHMI